MIKKKIDFKSDGLNNFLKQNNLKMNLNLNLKIPFTF